MTKRIPLHQDAFYHIYNRGNNRSDLFFEADNYRYFLQLWKKYIHPVAETYAYCLLKNHFHFLLRIRPDAPTTSDSKSKMPPIEQQFANCFNAYAKAINKRYHRSGKVFEERFRRKLIDNERYLSQLVFYIHANPQKHGFCEDFRSYPHSSYAAFTSSASTLLNRETVLEWFGGKDTFQQFHADYQHDLKGMETYILE